MSDIRENVVLIGIVPVATNVSTTGQFLGLYYKPCKLV